MSERNRYPLSWPSGWKRTAAANRRAAQFSTRTRDFTAGYATKRQMTMASSCSRLMAELKRLGVLEGDAILSTNVKIRLDGLPYSDRAAPDDPGAAVYFRLGAEDRVLACDTWTRVEDNVAAVAAHIDAIRAIDRYGVGTLEQAFAGYAALPAKGDTWRSALGFGPDDPVTRALVDERFRERAQSAHPDKPGGSHDQMATLTEARDLARRALAEAARV